MEQVEGLFSYLCLLNVMALSGQMIVTLFVCATETWIIGQIIISTTVLLLFVLCTLGILVEIHCDKLYRTLCMTSWYLLKPNERKMFLMLIMASKQTKLLTCGKFMPLNLATFLQVSMTFV